MSDTEIVVFNVTVFCVLLPLLVTIMLYYEGRDARRDARTQARAERLEKFRQLEQELGLEPWEFG